MALCIRHLPWQALDWAEAKRFEERRPQVVVEAAGLLRQVVAGNAWAERQGIAMGDSEAQARLQSPDMIVHERSRALEQRLQIWLGEQLDGVSDRCQWLPPDRWLLNLAGLERLLGDEDAIARSVCERLRAARLRPALGIAGTRSAALLAAQAAGRRPGGCWILPRAETAAVLGELPLEVLRGLAGCSLQAPGAAGRGSAKLDGEQDPGFCLALFERWGLKTLGELAKLPRSGLAERLGEAGLAWQRWARGEDTGLLVPDRKPEPPTEFREVFDPPLEGYFQFLPWLERQCQDQCRSLERQDRALGAIEVELEVAGDSTDRDAAGSTRLTLARPNWRWQQTFAVPHREARRLSRQLELAIAARPPAAAIAAARVHFHLVAPRRIQPRLFGETEVARERTDRLLRRLGDRLQDGEGARMGSARLGHLHRRGAFEMAPFQPERTEPEPAPARLPGGESGLCLKAFRPPQPIAMRFPAWPASVRMPAWEAPLRLEGARCRLPESAVLLEVVHASGPWRVSGEWWSDRCWSGEEWDVEFSNRRLYRLWHDRQAQAWFLAGEYD